MDWLLAVFLCLGAAMELFAIGLPEKDAKFRMLARMGTIPIAIASVLGCVRLYMALPFWLALPAGVAVLAAGAVAVFLIVSEVLPSKMKPSE